MNLEIQRHKNTCVHPTGTSLQDIADVQHLLSILFTCTDIPSALVARHLSNLFGRASPKILGVLHEEYSHYLAVYTQACSQLKNPSEDERLIIRTQVSRFLSYFAHFEFPNACQLQFPHWESAIGDRPGIYRPVTYEVERLRLTPSWPLTPYHAYGLNPVDEPKASLPAPDAHLVFMGTTYPGGSGFLWTLLADLTPFRSVGALLLGMGRQVIEKWQTKLSAKHPIHVHGQSLGGAMALQMARDYPTLTITASHPAGVGGRTDYGENTVITLGGQDEIPETGNLPRRAQYVFEEASDDASPGDKKHPANKKGAQGRVFSHALSLPHHKGTQFYRLDPEKAEIQHKGKHRKMTVLHNVGRTVVFPLLVLASIIYAVYRLITSPIRAIGRLWSRRRGKYAQPPIQQESGQLTNVTPQLHERKRKMSCSLNPSDRREGSLRCESDSDNLPPGDRRHSSKPPRSS